MNGTRSWTGTLETRQGDTSVVFSQAIVLVARPFAGRRSIGTSAQCTIQVPTPDSEVLGPAVTAEREEV
ncbi:hypothetical protein B0T14DRAFT_526366 [Immersiella caudata]|uniref:Uncharacterized protein n=1 Tax=Immersiella caudata TaxID=314043 RepID=A0AA39WDP9_9PEZI|nr:hypothetical protein B0T14DRAFT_526366 [Immersiella caudata]